MRSLFTNSTVPVKPGYPYVAASWLHVTVTRPTPTSVYVITKRKWN